MKVFIFTYDRYDSLSTPEFFEKEGIDHIILCHSEEAKQKFIEGGKVNPNKIIATGKPKGLTNNRNYALDQMKEGEWALFMVDDLKNFLEYQDYDTDTRDKLPITTDTMKQWGKAFTKKVSAKKFLERCEESIKKADEKNIKLVGFAGFTNPLFLKNKWKYNALADGRAWLIKKCELRFDENVQMVDDVCWSAINIKAHGLLINQWIIPDCKRYTAGSFGSKEQRMPQRIEECKYLVENYPDQIMYATKKDWPDGSHIQIKPIGSSTESMGYYTSPRITGEFLDCSMPMTFDQYSNCGFNCLYCFSTFQRSCGKTKDNYLAKKYKKVNLAKFKSIFTDLDNPKNQFRNLIKNRITLQWGGLSDPLCTIEEKEGLGYEILKFLKEIKYPICFSSKSDLLLRDPKYLALFEGMGDYWSYKASIITLDEEKAKIMEAGTPSPQRRLEVLETLSKMGIWTILRLRPFIIGLSDLTYEDLINEAGRRGIKALSTEFFCLETRSTGKGVAGDKFKTISNVVGFDIIQFYKNISSTMGYLRLNYKIKEPYIKKMEALCKKWNMNFHVSDAHHKEKGVSGSCCGLPPDDRFKFSKCQFTYALQLAKKNGEVSWSDVSKNDVWLKDIEVDSAPGFNTGTTYKRNKKCKMSMYQYMLNAWNDTKDLNSPYHYFQGIMIPDRLDSEGNVVYKFNYEKANLTDFNPCNNCEKCN